MSSFEGWNALKVADLKAELKQHDLSTAGRKEELAQRLADVEAVIPSGQEPANHASDPADIDGNQQPGDMEMGDDAPQATVAESAPEPVLEAAAVESAQAVQDEQNRNPNFISPAPISMDVDEGAASPTRQTTDNVDHPTIDPLHDDADMDMADSAADNFVEDTTGAVTASPESIHPRTNGLYIANLMRPLRPMLLDRCIADIAGSNNATTLSFLDPIKTHAFVIFRDAADAARVRDKLHGRVWPDERTRRPLWVDYVSVDSIHAWIAEEKSDAAFFNNTGRGSGANSRFDAVKRWEVIYSENDAIDGDGEVMTTLRQIGSDTPDITGKILFDSSMLPGQAVQRNDSPPPINAPRGPRGKATGGEQDLADGSNTQQRRRKGRGGNDGVLEDDIRRTRTSPALDFQLAHPDLVQRRKENIASHRLDTNDFREASRSRSRSRDPRGGAHQSEYTKTHNRYSFEGGFELVDRGPELFDGIRPPHRERERRQQQQQQRGRGGLRNGGGPPTGPRVQGGPVGMGGIRRRRRGGRDRRRPYDDYRPSRAGHDDRGDRGDRRDGRGGRDGRGDGRRDEPRDWRDDRRDRKERNGGHRASRDEREGRLGGYDNRW